jgi:hypothetical protein
MTFYKQALKPESYILEPSAGQLFVLQRLLFEFITLFPIIYAPILSYLIGCAVVVFFLLLILQDRFEVLVRRKDQRILAIFLILLMPGVWEIFGNIVNLHWWLTIVAALILTVPPPANKYLRIIEYSFLAILGLSGLTSYILFPIIIWSNYFYSSKHNKIRFFIIIFTGLIQFKYFLESKRQMSSDFDLNLFLDSLVYKIGLTLLLGESYYASLIAEKNIFFARQIVFLLFFTILLIAYFTPRKVGLILIFTGISSALLGFIAAPEKTALLGPIVGGRYYAPLIGFIMFIAVLGLSNFSKKIKILSLTLLISVAFGIYQDYKLVNIRPIDKEALLNFQSCVTNHNYPCKLDTAPEGWYIEYP